MKPLYSPYALCEEAVRIIDFYSSDEMPIEQERQVVYLLNTAENYPQMSLYQLSLARRHFAEYYLSQGITGSALDQFKLALSHNSKLPIKKKIKTLSSIPKQELLYSVNADSIGEPNYDNIPTSSVGIVEDPHIRYEQDSRFAALWDITAEEYRQVKEKTMEKLHRKAEEDDNIYDEEFEKMLEERLSKLDELSRSEFYRLRTHRKNNGVLSAREIDLLTLEAMERSYNYRKDK